jgi:hypothetical protein
MNRIVWILLLVAFAVACRTIPVAGECPESRSLRCLSRKVCTEDRQRGCQVCRCEDVWESDPARQDEKMRGRVPE